MKERKGTIIVKPNGTKSQRRKAEMINKEGGNRLNEV
jgi:hypothetical protein